MTETPSTTDRLRHAVAYAISGTEPSADSTPSGPGAPFDAGRLIIDLGGADALRAHATTTRSAGHPWPHPVPARLRDGLGAAQLYAAIEQARVIIDGPRPTVRRPTAPSGDDLRLLRDVPPHHGG